MGSNNSLLVIEDLDGQTNSEALRRLYRIEGFDFNAMENILGIADPTPMIYTGLEIAIRELTGKKGPKVWEGKGHCQADVTITNPSRKENMENAKLGMIRQMYERRLSIPMDFKITFYGSDLDFRISSAEIPEFHLRFQDMTDETIMGVYNYFAPRYGEEGLIKEFRKVTKSVGLSERLIVPAYTLMLQDIAIRLTEDEEVQEAVRRRYQEEEERFSPITLKQFYSRDTSIEKGLIDKPGTRRYGRFLCIDGGKK